MTTTLIFIRHGKPDSNHSGPDASRPLSREGKETQERLGQYLQKEGHTPNKIYTSPLLRAVQSAKIVADRWELPITEEPALGIDFDSDRITALAEEGRGQTLFFVGHEPTLAQLANELVGEPLLPTGLSKSGAAVLRFDNEITPGSGQAIKVIHPDHLLEKP